MPANLKIRELPAELLLRVKQPPSIQSVLLNLSAGVVVALISFHTLSGSTRIAAFGVIAVIFGTRIFAISRGADVELRVNNLDFVSFGHSPSDYQPSTTSRADVYSLGFREANRGGGDFPDLPEGLYVEQCGLASWRSSTCVLPHTNRTQTDAVVEAILRVFPDTGILTPAGDEKPHFTLLNLSQPTDNSGIH